MQTSRLGDGRAHLTDAGAGLGPCACRGRAHDRSRLQARQVKCSARHAARDAAAPASAPDPGALSGRFADSLRGTRDSSDGARTPHRTDIPSPKSAGRPARPAWSSRRSSSYSPVAAPPAPSALSAAPTTTRATPWRRAPFATAVTGWATAALSADGPPPQLPALCPALLLAPEHRLRSSEARARDTPFHRQASLSSSSSPFRCTPPASPLCWWRAAHCRCFRASPLTAVCTGTPTRPWSVSARASSRWAST